MILKRLYDLAEREKLLDDPAFEPLPIPFVVKIGQKGDYLGIADRRTVVSIPSKKGPPKTKLGKGKESLVAKAHGNTANAGFARFFADTLARVLPVSNEPKSVASRRTFWEQIGRAASETNDSALLAAAEFGKCLAVDAELGKRISNDISNLEPAAGDRCTMAWAPDEGMTILDREPVRRWWRSFYAKIDAGRQQEGPQGLCQITGQYGPIATVHTRKIAGIPGGIASGVSLVSNDKAAFESYGLEGAANASIGYRAADGYTRAIQALVHQKFHKSKLAIGQTLFLFWTREKCDLEDVFRSLDGTSPEFVQRLLESPHGGREALVVKDNAFYCLTLSANSARVVVRDYLETTLREVKLNLRAWFADLRIIGAWGKEIITVFPLWQLATATALDASSVSPPLPARLMGAAIKGSPLPESALAACLRRLCAEGGDGFTAMRLGLIKLFLRRKGLKMDTQVTESSQSPAYICGRLMAVFERIQWGALGNVNATVIDRFYGTASTSPGLVYPRLFKSAQQHLGKLHSEKPGMAVNLEKDLEGLCRQITKLPNLLPLTDQGQFALGFYHQRAAYRHGRDTSDKNE